MKVMKEALLAKITSVREEFQGKLMAFTGDLALCNFAVSQGVVKTQVVPRVDVP